MTLAAICVTALVAVVAVSCASSTNVGLLAIVLAWLIGVFVAPAYGFELSAKEVAGFFPADLFLTLLGVTMLFAAAVVVSWVTAPWVEIFKPPPASGVIDTWSSASALRSVTAISWLPVFESSTAPWKSLVAFVSVMGASRATIVA